MSVADSLQIVCMSDPGRVRTHNEDSVETRPEAGVVVLADGMGGYNAGEVASGMATVLICDGIAAQWNAQSLLSFSRERAMTQAQLLIREQVDRANVAIYEAAQRDPHCAGMGTTLVMGLFYDNFVAVAHIGDSRLYRMRDGKLAQITRDHSLLQEQIDSGLISKEEARLSANKNLVTRALGIDPTVELDVSVHEIQQGDSYLFCSDGLNDMIADEEIEHTLGSLRTNPPLAVDTLIQAANDAGGRDNVSIGLVNVVREFRIERGLFARLKRWLSGRK